jgi:transposase
LGFNTRITRLDLEVFQADRSVTQMNFIGIDVSKDQLDIAFSPEGKPYQTIPNTSQALKVLARKLSKHTSTIVLEASGGYEQESLTIFHQYQLPVALVNPRQVRQFAQATGRLAKTDRIDAKLIALYGATLKPRLSKPFEAWQVKLKALVQRRTQVVNCIAQEKTRLKQANDPWIIQDIQYHLKQLKQRQAQLDKELMRLRKDYPTLEQKAQVLEQVIGVGPVLTHTLLSQMPELGHIGSKQVASLAGVAPFNCDSGLWKGKRRIWAGRSAIRKSLYMASLSAIKAQDALIYPFYKRLRNDGKPFKVAITACMRKLLIILNAKMRDALQAS